MRLHLQSLALASFIFALLFSGCSSIQTHAVGIVPLSHKISSAEYDVLGEAEGMSSEFNLLWVLPVTKRISIEDAFAEAIRSKGGNSLIGASVWSERQIWILGTINTIYVKGTVIRSAGIKEK
jgi:hypothetical protein